ncbi:hypothetical protein ACGF12_14000 [Kitasatospora sp. NPDC048296]|uniref:hypothetical protein n=1 Tax=Kitasatospora sp. NPDC048296 TaxID=3364048 RepID=UPI00371DD7D1
MSLASPVAYNRDFTPIPACDGKIDAMTVVGQAWLDALTQDPATRTRILRARPYARTARITELTISLTVPGQHSIARAGTIYCVLADDEATNEWDLYASRMHVGVNVATLPADVWRELTHIARALPLRWAQLGSAEITERLLIEAQRNDVPLLPTARDLHVSCNCPARRGMVCKHAGAAILQTARLLDNDPFTLLLLRGRSAADFLAGVADPDHRSLARSFRAGTAAELPQVSADGAFSRRHRSARPPLPPAPASGTNPAPRVSLTPMPGIDMDALTLLALRTAKRAGALLDEFLAETGPAHRGVVGHPRSELAGDSAAQRAQHRLGASPAVRS